MKKKTDSLYLFNDPELGPEVQKQNTELLESSPELVTLTTELNDLRDLLQSSPMIEESEEFVRKTVARLERPNALRQFFAALQPMRSSLEWSFASALLFLGLVVAPDSALLSEANTTQEAPYIDEAQDQEFLEALDDDYTSIRSDELLFDISEEE